MSHRESCGRESCGTTVSFSAYGRGLRQGAGKSCAAGLLLGLGVAIVASECAFAGPKKTDCPASQKINGTCTINGFINNIGDPGGFAGAVLSNEGVNGIVQSSSHSLEAIRQRRLQESRKKCADGFERVGNQCRAWGNRGDVRRLKGEMDLALADLITALGLAPKAPTFLRLRGEILRLKGDIARSIADFSEAIEINPGDIEAYAGRGVAHESNGDIAPTSRPPCG